MWAGNGRVDGAAARRCSVTSTINAFWSATKKSALSSAAAENTCDQSISGYYAAAADRAYQRSAPWPANTLAEKHSTRTSARTVLTKADKFHVFMFFAAASSRSASRL